MTRVTVVSALRLVGAVLVLTVPFSLVASHYGLPPLGTIAAMLVVAAWHNRSHIVDAYRGAP